MMTVRPLAGHHEYADAVHLQRMIWGWEELDLLPVRFFVVAGNIGGQVLGAFDDGFLCGFCLAIPGLQEDGTVYLHSHMLGVLPEYRNSGAGYLLKMAQREDALSRGIALVEWTFDPLELKNAYFNLEKLGAIVRTYVPSMYGLSTSRLQAGLPTDRCVAQWHLQRERQRPDVVTRVSVPTDINEIKRSDPGAARRIQESIGEQLQRHFAAGLAVTGFERSEKVGSYLLSSWPSK